jgi:small subunit ribosomal protein S1
VIEIDGERRRLSLSLKRVEPDEPVQPRADGGESVHLHPNLDLSGVVDDEVPAAYAELGEEAAAAGEGEPGEAAVELTEPEPTVEAEAELAAAAGVEAEAEAGIEAEADVETEAEVEADAAEAELAADDPAEPATDE